MKKSIYSLILLSFILMSSVNVVSQEIDEIFNNTYPELQDEKLFDDNVTDLSTEQTEKFRTLLQKLQDGGADMEALRYGALSADNTKAFVYKKVKKIKDVNPMVEKIVAAKNKIREYMGDKTRWGSNPEECKKNIALLQQTTKAGKYKEAYQYWNVLFHFYPRSIKTIYSKASDVLIAKYEKTNDDKWIDTLMMAYEKRIKYKFFGDGKYPEGYIRGRQAVDLLAYKKDDVEKAYPIFQKSIQLQDIKSEDAVLLSYMQATVGMFTKEKIDAAEVVDNYSKLSEILAKRLELDAGNEATLTAKAGIDKVFLACDASTCEQLIPAFQKRFDANKTDIEQLEKIALMLSRKECTDSQLFFDVAIEMDKIKPSALSKYALGMRYAKNEEYEKSEGYLREAVKLETVDSTKAKYHYKLAQILNATNKKSAAKSEAQKAIALKKDYGAPYILIATMYAGSGCSEVTVKGKVQTLNNVGYWAAVDKLIMAKSVDPSIADAANQLIGRYSGGFPNAEQGFMIGVTKGARVTVGCWIGESTTARF